MASCFKVGHPYPHKNNKKYGEYNLSSFHAVADVIDVPSLDINHIASLRLKRKFSFRISAKKFRVSREKLMKFFETFPKTKLLAKICSISLNSRFS
jgi:hypothetical protein